MKRMGYVVAMVAGLSLSAAVLAADPGGIKVGGNAAAIGVVGGDATNVAAGKGATAILDVGTIKAGTDVGGNATAIGVVGGDATNVAAGEDADARTAIGVLNSSYGKK